LNSNVDQIIYSADKDNTKLIGTGIFKETLDPAVIDYISSKIHNIQAIRTRFGTSMRSNEEIRTEEYSYVQLAQAFHERDLALRYYRELMKKVERERLANKPQKTIGKKAIPRAKPQHDAGSCSSVRKMGKPCS
jgi:hypothetical protein